MVFQQYKFLKPFKFEQFGQIFLFVFVQTFTFLELVSLICLCIFITKIFRKVYELVLLLL